MKSQLALAEPLPHKYTLTVPSLSFAGLLCNWATIHDIEYSHSVTGVGKRKSENTKTKLPIIIEFDSAADRAWLMEIARAQIALIRTPKPRRGQTDSIERTAAADRLQAAYEAMS
jgi:hypothetical protein